MELCCRGHGKRDDSRIDTSHRRVAALDRTRFWERPTWMKHCLVDGLTYEGEAYAMSQQRSGFAFGVSTEIKAFPSRGISHRCAWQCLALLTGTVAEEGAWD